MMEEKPERKASPKLVNAKPNVPPSAKPAPRRKLRTKYRENRAQINAILITFVVAVLAVFFGAQYFLRSGVFSEPGKIVFDSSMSELDQDFVNNNLPSDLVLEYDVTISSSELSSAIPDSLLKEPCTTMQSSDFTTSDCIVQHVLYDVLLPVAAWNSPDLAISTQAAKAGNLVSVWDLTAEQKLLQLDDKYYLDNYGDGGFFEYFDVMGERTDVEKVATALHSKIATFPSQNSVMTLAQTGVTALSRRMYTKLQQVGNASFFAEQIAPFLQQFEFVHTSNEASFSTLANGSNICAAPAMIDAITSSHINIIELTGNHNLDCGDDAAVATVEQYHSLGIQTFGGGVSAEAAATPLELTAKGNQVTLLGYNLSTGGYTLDATPGANYYTEEKAKADIAAAKARGDTVIIDIQYYECNEYVDTNENTICDAANSSAGDQIGFFRSLIDLGADIVVGTSAHQPQTYEQYHGGEIYYGLGNLFFDQSAWPGTTRSLILVHYFWQNQLIQTRIVPTVYGQDFQTALMSTTDATAFLARLLKVQPAA